MRILAALRVWTGGVSNRNECFESAALLRGTLDFPPAEAVAPVRRFADGDRLVRIRVAADADHPAAGRAARTVRVERRIW
jgi:hypothetical protein